MANKPNQKLKILYVADILRNLTDEEHPLNAEEICLELGKKGVSAERKSIYNDISVLQEYGLDIISVRAPKAGYFLGERDLEIPEVHLLADAVRAAGFITPKKTRDLLSKLEELLSIAQSKELHTKIYVSNRTKSDNEEVYYSIDVISKAISEHNKISLEYCKSFLNSERKIDESSKTLIISPYSLTWVNDHYYLVGNNAKYDNLIHLRLDRMKKVKVISEKWRHFNEVSEYTEFFDIADYTQKSFNMFGGELKEIVLRCSQDMLDNCLDKFSKNIFFRYVDESGFTISTKALISEGLIGWILQFGNAVEVVSPEFLRNKLTERVSQLKDMYIKKISRHI